MCNSGETDTFYDKACVDLLEEVWATGKPIIVNETATQLNNFYHEFLNRKFVEEPTMRTLLSTKKLVFQLVDVRTSDDSWRITRHVRRWVEG